MWVFLYIQPIGHHQSIFCWVSVLPLASTTTHRGLSVSPSRALTRPTIGRASLRNLPLIDLLPWEGEYGFWKASHMSSPCLVFYVQVRWCLFIMKLLNSQMSWKPQIQNLVEGYWGRLEGGSGHLKGCWNLIVMLHSMKKEIMEDGGL